MNHTLGAVPLEIREAYSADRFSREGHATVEALALLLGNNHQTVVDVAQPAALRERFSSQFPEYGTGDLTAEFARAVESSIRLHHPRVMGHQVAAPLPGAALADLTSSLLNNGMTIGEMGPAATAMEHAVIEWMSTQLQLPDGSGGVLTSGGSLGNLTAMLAMRQARGQGDSWKDGNAPGYRPTVLVSSDAHYSIARAVRIMGWGDDGATPVQVDSAHRLSPAAVDHAAADATSRGLHVLGVVASAGSTPTGSFDPLHEIADAAQRHGLWFHVDGAHGASLSLSSNHRHLLRGIESADSLVWDAHKLLMMPALVTAVLFRRRGDGYQAFAQHASYLFSAEHGEEQWWNIGLRTFECTKRMMALGLYATLHAYGVGLFRTTIDRLVMAAQALAAAIETSPDFELALSPSANIVCFRHVPANAAARSADERSAHQLRLRDRLVASGRYYIVTTRLGNDVWLRSALMNPLVEQQDLLSMLSELRELGHD